MSKSILSSRCWGAVALSTLMLVAAPGCEEQKKDDTEEKSSDEGKAGDEKKEDKDEGGAKGATEMAKVKIDDVKNLVKEGKPISADQYKKLILAHANCKVTDKGIDSKCEAVKIMRESMNRSQLAKDVLGGNSDLGQKLITHESPAVRIKAAQMMSSMLGTKKKSQAVIVKAANKEKNVAALSAMIRTVRNDGARNEDVGKLLLKMADHENPIIRKEAIYGLSSSWNKELEGGPDKLIAMMESDEDAEVRKTACKYAGGLGDAKMFPVYEKLLGNREDGELWGDCFEGLVAMWADYPLYGTSNEDAYKLTIELLNSTPRTKDIPPWTAMSDFGYLGKATNKSLVKWKETATWFKADDLKKALSSIVLDGDANWMARTGSVKALAGLGAEKAELEKLKKGLKDPDKGDDKHVAKALDKAIAGEK